MKKAIIGKKLGMTQIFDENGKVVPVTVVEAGPMCCYSNRKQLRKMVTTQYKLVLEK